MPQNTGKEPFYPHGGAILTFQYLQLIRSEVANLIHNNAMPVRQQNYAPQEVVWLPSTYYNAQASTIVSTFPS